MSKQILTKTEAVSLLVAVGLKAADKYSLDMLQKKINGLADQEDDLPKIPKDDKANRERLKAVLAAADNDEFVTVVEDAKPGKAGKADKGKKSSKSAPAESDDDADDVDDDDAEADEDEDAADDEGDAEDVDEPEEEEEVTTKTKKADKVKSNGKPAKAAAPKEKKEPAGVDKWGMRLGSRAARLNAVISATPKLAREIMEEAEYDKPIGGHLRALISKGFVVKTDDNKYRTTPTAKVDKGGKPDKKKLAKAGK